MNKHNYNLTYVEDLLPELCIKDKSYPIIFKRQAMMLYLYEVYRSKSIVGRMMNLTHATIIHAIKAHKNELEGFGSVISEQLDLLIAHAESHPEYCEISNITLIHDVCVSEMIGLVQLDNALLS